MPRRGEDLHAKTWGRPPPPRRGEEDLPLHGSFFALSTKTSPRRVSIGDSYKDHSLFPKNSLRQMEVLSIADSYKDHSLFPKNSPRRMETSIEPIATRTCLFQPPPPSLLLRHGGLHRGAQGRLFQAEADRGDGRRARGTHPRVVEF